jgi:hypothetical protein
MDDGVEVFVEVPGKVRRWSLGKVPLDKLHQVLPQVTALSIEGQYNTELTGRLVLPDAEFAYGDEGLGGAGLYKYSLQDGAVIREDVPDSPGEPLPAIYLITVTPVGTRVVPANDDDGEPAAAETLSVLVRDRR